MSTPISVAKSGVTTIVPLGTESSVARRVRIAVELVLVLAACVGIWFRWFGIDAQSMWADEGYTTWLTQYSPSAILKVLPTDTFPPLYYFLLHFWRTLFGNTVVALRSLSVLCSTLCVLVFFLLARRIFNDRLCGLVAAAFASLSFFPLWYAKEVRCYALLELLSCLCIYWMVLTLERASNVRLLVLALWIAALLYTHTMTLFYMPGLVIFWLCYPSQLSFRGRLKRGALVGAIVFAIYAPWIKTFWTQVSWVHASFWPERPSLRALTQTICMYSGVDPDNLQIAVRSHLPKTRLFGFWSWALLVLLTLGFGFVQGIRNKDAAVRRKALAILLFAALPILLVFLDSRILTSVYVNRVFIGAGVFLPLLLLVPVAFSNNERPTLRLAPALVMLSVVALSLAIQEKKRDDWRRVTRYLLSLPETRREVFAFQPYCQILVNYYVNDLAHPGHSVPISGLMSKADLEDSSNPNPRLPVLANAHPLGMLTQAIDSGQYKEVDVALQMYHLTPDLLAMPSFLHAHCASVTSVDFKQMSVTRCIVKPQ